MNFDKNYLSNILVDSGISVAADRLELLDQYVLLLLEWNEKINLISRKDIEYIWRNHILHSLAVLAGISLPKKGKYVDIGTGGGLPGIPLAIMMPYAEFLLCDSIGKKIRAVENIVADLGINNVECRNIRVETLANDPGISYSADIILARAVTRLEELVRWSYPLLRKHSHKMLVAWKGGDLTEEIREAGQMPEVNEIRLHEMKLVGEDYFIKEEKKIIQVIYNE